MKLWEKGSTSAAEVDRFTVGQDRTLDLRLAPWDVLGTLAHTRMLTAVGLLEATEWDQLQPALVRIYQQIEAGDFQIEPEVEDIHSQVELMLTRKLGDIGKKIHSGRSRNDQVLVDLKLYFKYEIQQIVGEVEALFEILQQLSETHKGKLLPGYTHLQVAMPSSFGLWFGAFAEALVEDLLMLHAAWETADRNPLGSAAGYGSSFPLDRKMTTHLLGFSTLHYNVVNAQLSRGRTEKVLSYALAAVAGTCNKLATDVCLYMSQNMGFIRFPDALTTGSSIMPHKKNPDVFELVRGHTARLQQLPSEISALSSNLPSGYHRDMQLLKDVLFPAIDRLRECLRILAYALPQIEPQADILNASLYDYLFSVEVVNEKVKQGIPFREAYKQIGMEIESGTFIPQRDLDHSHVGSLGNLATASIGEEWKVVKQRFSFTQFEAAQEALLGGEGE